MEYNPLHCAAGRQEGDVSRWTDRRPFDPDDETSIGPGDGREDQHTTPGPRRTRAPKTVKRRRGTEMNIAGKDTATTNGDIEIRKRQKLHLEQPENDQAVASCAGSSKSNTTNITTPCESPDALLAERKLERTARYRFSPRMSTTPHPLPLHGIY